jgi:hypothetical protein
MVRSLESPCHAVEPSDGTCLRQSTKVNGQGSGQFQIADFSLSRGSATTAANPGDAAADFRHSAGLTFSVVTLFSA